MSRVKTEDYRHTREKRINIPPAKIAAEGTVPKVPKARYYYSPHLPPVLRFDPTGVPDKLPELIVEAGRRPLRPEEQRLFADALRRDEPWLEWATKREQHEKGVFEVDPVALHIHERVSAQAIVRAAMREDVQRSLFADPEQPYQQAVQFYRHDIDWTNRLILGDSLQVMSSLARRERLAGKVQMIYIDPPYGIRFGTNFQPLISETEVGDRDRDLTREPETVRAYRDTWELGLHSYLTYLRDRLFAARELLAMSGSLFVQISDANVHRVRLVMDEIFGVHNFVAQIQFKKTGSASSAGLATVCDYLLWYARDKEQMFVQPLYEVLEPADLDWQFYDRVLTEFGQLRPLTPEERRDPSRVPNESVLVARNPIVSPGTSKTSSSPILFEGESVPCPPGRHWSQDPAGMQRLIRAGRLSKKGKTLRFVRRASDSRLVALTNAWMDLGSGGFVGEKKKFIVKTDLRVIERCLLLATRPGDLVLDPTCGGGSAPLAAEKWGRRWIAVDTSRVAVAISRQRLMTEYGYPYFRLKDQSVGPRGGFFYGKAQHLEPSDIAKNINLDPICAKHDAILDAAIEACNKALKQAPADLRRKLGDKLLAKWKAGGKSGVTDADGRRWELPKDRFEHWTVPFDVDPDWPKELQEAVTAYRKARRVKMDEVNACIAANAEDEELVDQPDPVKGVVRVSGPFTVEGVRPAELSLDEDGLFGGAPETLAAEDEGPPVERQNVHAYLTQMVQHLRADGVTFLGNKRRRFARVEPLFETATGGVIHAEGLWEGEDESGPNTVAIGFGPQYGPVTAEQVEDLVRASKRYDELVIAGFSFDAAASAAIQEASHPKLRIHQAHIRPDINPSMEGLLKDIGNSQLFTVFGQPVIEIRRNKDDEFVCELECVIVYDPIESVVRSADADKVAAWFLDSDYDGRCFCITQAFFPRQDAWEKIAKALRDSADAEAFAAFAGTTSLPFRAGKHRRIAVKVIDPRGNEVMAVRSLKA